MCSSADEQIVQHAMLADLELLCKNRCGFYGTPQCEGLCSRCWRDFQLKSKRHNDYQNNIKVLRQHQNEGGTGGAMALPPASSSASSARKGSDVRFNSLKTLLKKSPSVFSASTYGAEPPQSPLITLGPRPPSPDTVFALERLHQFLDANFPPAYAKELDKQCQVFIDNIFKSEFLPSEEQSLLVQAFYQSIKESAGKFVSQMPPPPPPPPEAPAGDSQNASASSMPTPPAPFSISDFMTEIETFVCTRAYPVLFGSRTEEEAEDLSLQTRIRSLHWVTNGFLETALDESSGQVQEYLNEAITEIVDLNSHRPVTKKLDCLVRCSKDIFDALRESRSGAPASADEFLPVLILIVLRANPPLIQSNLKFISRFGLPSRHMRGEYGYYYTNLSSAIYFIQDMKAASLQISEEEFERYMSGRTVPPPRNSISTSVVRSFENSLHKLDKLQRREEALSRKTDELNTAFESDLASFKERICQFAADDDGTLSADIKEGIRKALCSEDNDDKSPTAKPAEVASAEEQEQRNAHEDDVDQNVRSVDIAETDQPN